VQLAAEKIWEKAPVELSIVEKKVPDQRFPKFVIGLGRRQILTVRQFLLFASSATGSAHKRTISCTPNYHSGDTAKKPLFKGFLHL